MRNISATFMILALLLAPGVTRAQGVAGYYRFPSIHGGVVVFTSEGDLWKVSAEGGLAQRLTTDPGVESRAAISPDGSSIAFTAQYEGPSEVYLMPLEGGLPKRLTYEGGHAYVVGWTPDGKVLYSTTYFSTLPDRQLATVDPRTLERSLLPLSQASDGSFAPDGKRLFFTRLPFQGSHTKRYAGGSAQNIWRFTEGALEAIPLTADYTGTSKTPMFWLGRIYFASDRDGTMNIWSMDSDGNDVKQETHHKGWDVKSPSLHDGMIVYQLGADIWLLDLRSGSDEKIPITLASDLEQSREKWVKDPMTYLTWASISPDGDRVALTARGRVFVAPVKQGRLVEVTRKQGVRYRWAQFFPDGKSLFMLSDETGELEFWKARANGIGDPEILSENGSVFRFRGVVSPDGASIAFTDKNLDLWVYQIEKREMLLVTESNTDRPRDLAFSPDSRWLAYVAEADNFFPQIVLYRIKDRSKVVLTSDRVDSYSPAWSPDGKWIYFASDRNFESSVPSPWGPRQPEPFFERTGKLYLISLKAGERSPFQPADELSPEAEKTDEEEHGPEKRKDSKPVTVEVDVQGIQQRIHEVPVESGNFTDLRVGKKHLFWIDHEKTMPRESNLVALEITNRDPKPETILEGIGSYQLSFDRSKILARKGNELYVFEASGHRPEKLDESRIDLKDWMFTIDPREEWRQILVEAWRLERDYFYDPQLHGVDWQAVLEKHLPLVERVNDRDELTDLIGDLVGELAALHTFVWGGDVRRNEEKIEPASLGALLIRDEDGGGYRIQHIYQADPDYPEKLAPLKKPGVDLGDGDLIEAIDGVSLLLVSDPAMLLKNKVGRQVLLKVKRAGSDKSEELIVTPFSQNACRDLRYQEWEYSRRQLVEKLGQGEIGYVHLRAMGRRNFTEWIRNFYPVYQRKGLVVDVRHNSGGNIDSWILEKLLRRAWFYWKPRAGKPYWNMQYAFRGHMILLCDSRTASDGEAFTEGFRRLGLGKVFGTRTWGGEIWLSFDNYLVDGGIASAAEIGVYGPEGKWLIEGHGVDPDSLIDNPPHETFNGEDRQLEAAVKYLRKEILEHPVPVPPAPPYPDKSFKYE